jgi:hypothetical protein
MTQMDARITELVARPRALKRERAEILAEINTLRSVRSEEAAAIKAVPSAKADDPIDRNSTIEKKIALFRRLFRGRSDVFPVGRIVGRGAAGTHLPVRMSGSVEFAKTKSQMFGMSKSGIPGRK